LARRSTCLTLLADASILIDLDRVGGVEVLPRLAPTEVLDVVLAEVDNPHQPQIANRLRSAGAVIVPTELAWIAASQAYRVPGLSDADTLGLYYALTFGRILLAGDRKLRTAAAAVGVDVHRSLWLVEELHAQGLVPPAELMRWLTEWPRLGRRLPPREVARIRSRLTGR
jgi:hypothetical protein